MDLVKIKKMTYVVNSIITIADDKLYSGKNSGKNRVVV